MVPDGVHGLSVELEFVVVPAFFLSFLFALAFCCAFLLWRGSCNTFF